jgi:hypothetical protein
MLSSVVSLLALAKPYGSDAQVRAIYLSICSLKGRSLKVKYIKISLRPPGEPSFYHG